MSGSDMVELWWISALMTSSLVGLGSKLHKKKYIYQKNQKVKRLMKPSSDFILYHMELNIERGCGSSQSSPWWTYDVGRWHPEPLNFGLNLPECLAQNFAGIFGQNLRQFWSEPSGTFGKGLLELSSGTFLAFGLEPTYVTRTFWKLRLVMLCAGEPCLW